MVPQHLGGTASARRLAGRAERGLAVETLPDIGEIWCESPIITVLLYCCYYIYLWGWSNHGQLDHWFPHLAHDIQHQETAIILKRSWSPQLTQHWKVQQLDSVGSKNLYCSMFIEFLRFPVLLENVVDRITGSWLPGDIRPPNSLMPSKSRKNLWSLRRTASVDKYLMFVDFRPKFLRYIINMIVVIHGDQWSQFTFHFFVNVSLLHLLPIFANVIPAAMWAVRFPTWNLSWRRLISGWWIPWTRVTRAFRLAFSLLAFQVPSARHATVSRKCRLNWRR